MDHRNKAALKKFLHQHVDDLVDHFARHLLAPEVLLDLTLSNRCVRNDVVIVEQIRCRIVTMNDESEPFAMEEVFFDRDMYEDEKTLEHLTVEIIEGGLV